MFSKLVTPNSKKKPPWSAFATQGILAKNLAKILFDHRLDVKH
jgi:hypothetical protein